MYPRLGRGSKRIIAEKDRGLWQIIKKPTKEKPKRRGSVINDHVAYVHSLIRVTIVASNMCLTNKFPLSTAGRLLGHGDPSSQTSPSHI